MKCRSTRPSPLELHSKLCHESLRAPSLSRVLFSSRYGSFPSSYGEVSTQPSCGCTFSHVSRDSTHLSHEEQANLEIALLETLKLAFLRIEHDDTDTSYLQ